MSSTGPSTAPNQCGVWVLNSTASPGSIVKSCVAEAQPHPAGEDVDPVVALVDAEVRGRDAALAR